MKNLPFTILLCFLAAGISACAQTSFIKKGKAFMMQRSTGTEMLDDNGNPTVQPKIVNYVVYVELTGPVSEWKYAWYKNQAFTLNPTKVEQKKLQVGIDKATGKKVTIVPAKGNQLWQLELTPSDSPKNLNKTKGGEILLEGLRQNRKFRYQIPKLIVLQTPDAV